MVSISISIGFILGFWIAPARVIGALLASIGLSNSISGALIGQLAAYCLPAILTYWLLSTSTIRSRIIATNRALWLLRICNLVSFAYVVILLLARLIPGGGPSFVVGQYGIVTIVPAIAISMLVLVQVAQRSFGKRGFTASIAVGVLLIAIVPFRSYLQKSAGEDVWGQYCLEAGDRFLSKPVDFKALQFRGMGQIEVFTSVVGQSYAEAHREYVGISLIKRGYLQEYENVNSSANPPSTRIYLANGIQEEPLANSQATHFVSISFPESKVPRFQRLRMTVTDVKTGRVIAESNRVVDNITAKKRVCGQVKNGTLDSSDFVAKALYLAPTIQK